MDDPVRRDPIPARASFRIATAAIGSLLAGVGTWLLADATIPAWPRFGVGIPLVVVGADAIVAALRARAPWLARLGPLP